jgi:hypothetical protein
MNRFDEEETVSNKEDLISGYEYKKIKYRRTMPDKKIIIFTIGWVLGIICFYILGGDDIIISESFWEDGYSINENTGFIQYIFSLRFKQLIFLLICSFSYIGNLMAYGLLGSLGFEFGIILFTFAYNYKLKGILLSVAMNLPHGIFYLLVLLIIFERCYNGDKPSIYKEKWILLWKIVITVILFLLGFLCETCINYEILQKLLLTILAE